MRKINLILLILGISIICKKQGYTQNTHSLQFGPSNRHAVVPYAKDLNFDLADFTIEVWFLAYPSQPTYPQLLSNRNNHGDGFLFGLFNDGKFYMQIAGDHYHASTPDLRDGVWHHIVATRSGSSLTYYLDGKPAGTNNTMNHSMSTSTHDLWIGQDESSSKNTGFNGLIDQVRFWNISKSSDEINKNMNGCLTGTEKGLVGLWNFNQGTGTVASDLSAKGNDGTLMSNTAWTTTVPYCCQSINQSDDEELYKISQNPKTGQVNIEGKKKITSIYVFDATGLLLISKNQLNTSKTNVDLSDWGNGKFMISIFNSQGNVAQKVITID